MNIIKLSQNKLSLVPHLRAMLSNAVKKDAINWTHQPWKLVGDHQYWKSYSGSLKIHSKRDFILDCYFTYSGNSIHQINMILRANTPSGILDINKWGFNKENPFPNDETPNAWKSFMDENFGIKDALNPLEEKEVQDKLNPLKPISIIDGFPVYFYTRLTKIKANRYSAAKALEVIIRKVRHLQQSSDKKNFVPLYRVTNLELNSTEGFVEMATINFDTYQDALSYVNKYIEIAMKNGFVDKTSLLYIPEGADTSNWDFVSNSWKKEDLNIVEPKDQLSEQDTEKGQPQNEEDEEIDLRTLVSQRVSDDTFQGYYSGPIPDYAAGMVGSSSVDASQISSAFSYTDRAIQMVNRFDSSLLRNIAFIFNFSKAGAYGVYLPSLDRAIKTKALEKRLESQGYEIREENGLLTAYPTKEEKSTEQIESDIDRIYKEIESGGGTALGINMNNVIASARDDAQRIQSPDANVWELMALLHLGETIVHEATHSKGVMDESGAEAVESQFVKWALPQINEEYKNRLEAMGMLDQFNPIVISTERRHASSNNWYKLSQNLPQAFMAPYGSDLSGRHRPETMLEDANKWTMMSRMYAGGPIEKQLGRQYMAPLPQDLSQEHDSIEMQLRKYRKWDPEVNISQHTEILLSEDHDDSASYRAMEELLDENRPHPLMKTLSKNAAIHKEATLFGWYNNLSISDGSTIPGLGDRVMAWEDRDEDFAREETWIKKQFRYNPTYDYIKGFYYQWIEPRFKPSLFEDLSRDYSNTSPALRFAQNDNVMNKDVSKIIKILKLTCNAIEKQFINGTRFIISEDVMRLIKKVLEPENVNLSIFNLGNTDDDETVYSLWVYSPEIDESKIQKAENSLRQKCVSDEDIDSILMDKKHKTQNVSEIVECAREVCKEYDIDQVYLVGSYARQKIEGVKDPCVSELNFISYSIDDCIKMGSIIAEKIGATSVGDGKYVFKNIFFDCCPKICMREIEDQMKLYSIDSEDVIMREICNRDFTINMVAYDFVNDKIKDPFDHVEDIKNKVLTTMFDPHFILNINPYIIIRAMQFKTAGYEIDQKLKDGMNEFLPHIFEGNVLEKMKEYINA